MVTLPNSLTPHPTRLLSYFEPRLFMLLLGCTVSMQALSAQEITGLEVIKTITHENYSVNAIDAYFKDGRQLIAYSNTSSSGSGDTLVIYDFEQDQVLLEVPATTWSFDIGFVNSHHLLFRNSGTLYSVHGFSFPLVNELLAGVYSMALSDDKTTVAMLRQPIDVFTVELAEYDPISGTLNTLDEFELPDPITDFPVRLSFSPEADYIAINGGYENNYVYIINTVTGDVTKVPTPDNGGTYSPDFYEQNGKLRVAVGGGFTDGAIEVINVDELEAEASIPAFPHYNYSLDFNPTQNYLVSGGYDGIIKLFRVEGTTFTELEDYPIDFTTRVLFTQDNQYVISGHGAGTAMLVIHRILNEPSGTSAINEQLLMLYPNPTSGLLFIGDDVTSAWVTVFDMSGREVVTRNQVGPSVNLSSLKDGMYLLKVQDEKGIRNNLFVKE